MPLLNKRTYDTKITFSNKINNLNHIAVYNTGTWRKLRLHFLSKNPLCWRCLQNGKLKSSRHAHHRIEISKGKTIMEKRTLGFDWNNLEALCEDCHIKEHKNRKQNDKTR